MAYILPFSSFRLKSNLNIQDFFGKSIAKEDLVKDMSDGLYIYQCQSQDETHTGFFSLMKLEEPEREIVYFGENSMDGDLIHATYKDERNIISKKLQNITERQVPRYDFSQDGEHFRLWVLNDTVTIQEICEDLVSKKINIVSGGNIYMKKIAIRDEARENNSYLRGGETTMVFLSSEESSKSFHTPPSCLLKESAE